jgi:hypothetical protein
MPKIGIRNGIACQSFAADTDESQPLRFDLRLKDGIGDHGRPMSARLQRHTERDEGIHIAGAAQCRQ